MKQKLRMKKKRSLDERDKFDKEILSIMKTIDLQGQHFDGNSKRDNNENNIHLTSLQNLLDALTGNIDSK